ncbi:MAG: OmpA family protein [Chitinophagaceae bacterium]|nr:OmpA family protein [Chitinophagaceae bacterium]
MKHWLLLGLLLSIVFPLHAQEKTYRILFPFNAFELPDSVLWPLNKLMHAPHLDRVLIEGHCDSIGSVNYNLHLSKQRAQAVKQFLLSNGIPEPKIKTCIGWGKQKPLADNQLEFGRQQNRRVDITFYYNTQEPIPAKPNKQQKNDTLLAIEKVSIGDKIQLDNLYFQPGRHIIKPESYTTLIRLLKTMLHYKNLRIEIQGHVCCTAPDSDGFDWDTETDNLSENRAAAVADFLIQGGVSPKRLTVKGFGGSQKMVEDEELESNKALNRRVVLRILNK